MTEIFDTRFDTTGVFGLSKVDGDRWRRAASRPGSRCPSYQDLATGRRWHFFFAWLFVINGLVYIAYSIASGHWRQLVPTGAQLRHIGASIREHLLAALSEGRGGEVLQRAAEARLFRR